MSKEMTAVSRAKYVEAEFILKPRLLERFFAYAGDAIFSNFVASPARDENRTCSHPRTSLIRSPN